MQNRFSNIKEAEEFLASVPQFAGGSTGFSYGSERARLLLEQTGHPEKELKIIHVAGSNGKGSVCALLDTALRSAGLRTGFFSSPHLKDIRERIRLSGELIPEDDFVNILNEVLRAEEAVRLKFPGFCAAYFEYFFIAALLYFNEQKADAVILETGLGGRLDATNACDNPVLSIITPVSLEHTQVLGDTIDQIATEKAGIIKYGVPVVVMDTDKEALKVFRTYADKAESRLVIFEENSVSVNKITDANVDFSLHNSYYRNVTVTLPMPALYEAKNAGLALTALAVLAETESFKGISAACLAGKLPEIISGFASFEWPGRMQCIQTGVYVDGAHNPAGIRAFIESTAAFATGKKNVLLFAVSDDKDKSGMIRELCGSGLFSDIVVTAFSGARSAQADETARLFRDFGAAGVSVYGTVTEAYEKACEPPHDYVFCAGSLYLAGEIKCVKPWTVPLCQKG